MVAMVTRVRFHKCRLYVFDTWYIDYRLLVTSTWQILRLFVISQKKCFNLGSLQFHHVHVTIYRLRHLLRSLMWELPLRDEDDFWKQRKVRFDMYMYTLPVFLGTLALWIISSRKSREFCNLGLINNNSTHNHHDNHHKKRRKH